MVASKHGKRPACVGEVSAFDVLHPGPEDTEGDLIFFLARDGAGVAADATVVVDDESVFHGPTIVSVQKKLSRI